MQQSVGCISTVCDNFGFTISTKKTKIMHQPAPQLTYEPLTITVNDETLEAVKKFTWLGSTLSRSVNIDTEVNSKASIAFGRPRETVWERRGIRLFTKLKVNRAAVLSSLLYTRETWTMYERHAKVLNRFHLNCLRKLLRITWRDKVADTEVLSRTGLPSIYTLLKRSQVRCAKYPTHASPKDCSMVNLQRKNAGKVDSRSVTTGLSQSVTKRV